MYKKYFGLKEPPFSIAPDPRYLYMSDQHREALAHLFYGVNSDGAFVLLTGEVGTGKTTVCRCFLEQIPKNCDVAFILNPKLTVGELLSTICDEFGIRYPQGNTSVKVFVDLLNAYLLNSHARGRKAVLIIDEAQNLGIDVLEQLRLLTNLETNQRKLLQIILLGQPELRDILLKPELRQLAQRIVARYHLGSLTKRDLIVYVHHRLALAGARDQLFPASTILQLYRLSGGIPRLINVLCDRALLGAYVQGKSRVDDATLAKAAREVFGELGIPAGRSKKAAIWLLAFLLMIGGSGLLAAARYNPKLLPMMESLLASTRQEQQGSTRQEPGGAAGRESSAPKPEDSSGVIGREPAAPAPQELPEMVRQDSQDLTRQDLFDTTLRKPIPPPDVFAGLGHVSEEGAKSQPRESVPAASENTPPVPEAVTNQVPPEMTIQWLLDHRRFHTEIMAYEVLFKQWGASLRPQVSTRICRQAEARGLRCLSGRGGLDDLRKLNRPAVLKLYDNQGQECYEVLTALGEKTAAFSVGTETFTVSLDEIALWWRGEYTLLWRAPPKYRGSIQPGERGPGIQWLKARLAGLKGISAQPVDNPILDNATIDEVKKFQLSSGMKPDGVIGPHTLIRLDNATGGSGPVLTGRDKEK